MTGRNYLEVGFYMEVLLPKHNVRFIAVNSGVKDPENPKKLKAAKIDCPTIHWMKQGRNAPAKTPDDPYHWAPRTVSGILDK